MNNKEICGKEYILCNDPVCEGDTIADDLEKYIGRCQILESNCDTKNKTENMTFGEAIEHLKKDSIAAVTRVGWRNASIKVMLQTPDENSKMTEKYLYMEKLAVDRPVRFPLDLSCESVLAEDWMIIFQKTRLELQVDQIKVNDKRGECMTLNNKMDLPYNVINIFDLCLTTVSDHNHGIKECPKDKYGMMFRFLTSVAISNTRKKEMEDN